MFESSGYKGQASDYASYMTSTGTINKSAIYTVFGISLIVELFGFGLSGFLTSGLTPGYWMLLCLIPAFGGIFMARSDSAIFSLFGGIACAVGLGAISGPEIASYKIGSIVNIAAYTAGITLCMTIASAIFRNWLAGIGGALFGGLCLLIFGDFVAIFMSMMGFNVAPALTFLDCVAVVLFSIYIAYDMMVLDSHARTADDAVDMSVSVFLDIINLFMSLLRLLGSKDDD